MNTWSQFVRDWYMIYANLGQRDKLENAPKHFEFYYKLKGMKFINKDHPNAEIGSVGGAGALFSKAIPVLYGMRRNLPNTWLLGQLFKLWWSNQATYYADNIICKIVAETQSTEQK